MERDKLAIGAPTPPGEPCAEVLHPFLPWLTGSLLLVGPRPDAGSRARWAPTAAVVHTADGADFPASTRFDAVVLLGLLSRRDDGGGCALDATIAWAQERLRTGGRLILDSVQDACGLTDEQMAASREVLRRFGNMSSASIMFILRDLLSAQPARGRALAFGPGLTVEVMDFTLLANRRTTTIHHAPAALAAV